MIGPKEMKKSWLDEAMGAYEQQDKDKFYDLDTQVKSSFMLSILKQDQEKLKNVYSQLLGFFLREGSPSIKKWDGCNDIIYGWKAIMDISRPLYQEEPISKSIEKILNEKDTVKIFLTIAKDNYITESNLEEKLKLSKKKLKSGIDYLIGEDLIEQRHLAKQYFLRMSPRGYMVVKEFKKFDDLFLKYQELTKKKD